MIVGHPFYRLPIDPFRRPPAIAWELYKLCTEKEWVRHLANDHYLSRPEFEKRYSRTLPRRSLPRGQASLRLRVLRRPVSSSSEA